MIWHRRVCAGPAQQGCEFFARVMIAVPMLRLNTIPFSPRFLEPDEGAFRLMDSLNVRYSPRRSK